MRKRIVKKRVTSVLLALTMGASILTGCSVPWPDLSFLGQKLNPDTGDGNAAPGEQKASEDFTVSGTVDIIETTKEFEAGMDQALIMLAHSDNCYTSGTLTRIEDVAPEYLSDILFVPAGFVARCFGGSAARDGENGFLINVGETDIRIPDNSDYILVNGEEVLLPFESDAYVKDALVPAEVYCQALGKELFCSGNLILIGDDLAAVAEGAGSEDETLIFSAIETNLASAGNVGGMKSTLDNGATYEERASVSVNFPIGVEQIPYEFEKDKIAAVAGSLYVENLNVKPSAVRDGVYDCSMTVYNYLGYVYGSVEVYDKNDVLVDTKRIQPYGGQKDSIVSAVTDVGVLAGNMCQSVVNWDLDYLNHRTSLNSSINNIQVEVPEGGYIFLTCNPQHSGYVMLYDMVHTIVECFMSLKDVADVVEDAWKGGSVDIDFKDMMKDALMDVLLEDPGTAASLAAEFEDYLGSLSGGALPWKHKAYVEEQSEKLLEIFNRLDIDIGSLMAKACSSMASKTLDAAAEKFVRSVLPVTGWAFDIRTFINSAANLFCLYQDLDSICESRSILIEICDWRESYAEILKEEDRESRFALGYINRDGVPELIILNGFSHFGSYAKIYSWRNRKIEQFTDYKGDTEISIPYAVLQYIQLQSMLVRGDMHMGISSLYYQQLRNGAFQTVCSFVDSENAGETTDLFYTWNGRDVSRKRYMKEIEKLDNEYKESIVRIDGYSVSYEISDANIEALRKGTGIEAAAPKPSAP